MKSVKEEKYLNAFETGAQKISILVPHFIRLFSIEYSKKVDPPQRYSCKGHRVRKGTRAWYKSIMPDGIIPSHKFSIEETKVPLQWI